MEVCPADTEETGEVATASKPPKQSVQPPDSPWQGKRVPTTGGLLSLTVSGCDLKGTFATAAALNMRHETRLRKLDVKKNAIGVSGRAPGDATVFLNALAASRTNFEAEIECGYLVHHDVVQKLVDVLAATQYLRDLTLNTNLPEDDGARLLRALALNGSVRVLNIKNFTFSDVVVSSLGELIRNNRCINYFTISFADVEEGRKQVRPICRMLDASILRNRELVSLEMKVGGYNHANLFTIKAALRRNMMNVHQAALFVNGCNERSVVLAFQEYRYSHSLTKALTRDGTLSEEDALVKIRDARTRFAAGTSFHTSVVKRSVAWEQHLRRATHTGKSGD
ncbi:hypothetical protein MTO96_026343 [Rhipicephalus appendiculatus]